MVEVVMGVEAGVHTLRIRAEGRRGECMEIQELNFSSWAF